MTDNPLLPIKVNIEHKKSVTQDIPEDVTRARNSAWLDIISPITEWAGLKGDALSHKRNLLRLEREASLFELSQKLRDRLEGKTISQIPTKQLIPALEKASLEEPGSEFIDKWANLLASAVQSPGDDVAICTSILGDLGPTEARLLERANAALSKSGLSTSVDANKIAWAWDAFVKSEYKPLQALLADHLEDKVSWEEINPRLIAAAERSPNVITYFQFTPHSPQQPKSFSLKFTEQEKVAIDVLKFRNLLDTKSYMEMLEFKSTTPFRGTLNIGFFNLTNLGLLFLRRVSGAELKEVGTQV